ncbi:MAG: CinA family nicotinamide mononucleotide deamidase-related protein [Pirellulaceae bacterium]|nr:CinA family nicotinamide mononucleotide deamidase-related protein [Pirellulaceae bacterium]
MRAEIIAIGDELTTGQRLDTNSQWLAERLGEIGVPVAFHTTVGDQLADNLLVFRQACERADIVVASGGLGPTADDLTRQALAEVAGVPLVQDDASLAHIRSLFARRKREMPPANLIQAQFPQGSRPIPNPHGTAPGIDCEIPRAVGKPARVFALPGVPAEMKEMWAATVSPAIQQHVGTKQVIAHYCLKCFGVGESDLEAMLPDIIARNRYPLVGITVHQATISLRITAAGETVAAARAAMEPTIATIRQCLGDLIYGDENDELQHAVVRLLRERHKTLSVAEWGTCGLVSRWLAETEAADVLCSETIRIGTAGWTGEPPAQTDSDLWLAIGPCPVADSPTTTPGNIAILLRDGDRVVRKDSPFAGHPDILRPRAAKQALNLLRLHLLGKNG